LADFLVGFTPNGVAGALANTAPELHECVMNWCVQTLQSNVAGSLLTENLLNVQQLNTDHIDNPWASRAWYLSHFNLTLPDKSAPGGFSTFGLGNEAPLYNQTARATLDVIQQAVPSTWTVTNLTDSVKNDPNPFISGKLYWPSGDPALRDILLSEIPWSTPNNVTQHVEGWAAALTATVRKTAHGGTNTFDYVVGDAFEEQVHVQIRWLWLILPAALLFFSLIFLVVTVIKSSREDAKIGIWKSSALAILFNGPGEEVQDAVGSNPTRLGSVREKAKNLKVTLREDP